MRYFEIVLIVGSTCVLGLLNFSSAVAIASPTTPNSHDVYFGPSIIYSAKHMRVYRPDRRDGELSDASSVEIYSQDKNFKTVRTWIFKNIFPILNSNRKVPSKTSEFCLALSTLQKHNMTDILLIVPLNLETLGPEYLERIEELRSMMKKRED
jgi:hypothetical protein